MCLLEGLLCPIRSDKDDVKACVDADEKKQVLVEVYVISVTCNRLFGTGFLP